MLGPTDGSLAYTGNNFHTFWKSLDMPSSRLTSVETLRLWDSIVGLTPLLGAHWNVSAELHSIVRLCRTKMINHNTVQSKLLNTVSTL